jgi:hypothetical protein
LRLSFPLKCLPAKREEKYGKRREILCKSFRAKLRGEQNGNEHQKESRFFRQFAVARRE